MDSAEQSSPQTEPVVNDTRFKNLVFTELSTGRVVIYNLTNAKERISSEITVPVRP